MNRQQGPVTQSLRSMQGNFFAQPNSNNTNRTTQPMANQRAPNGKIGGAVGWGAGMPPLGGAGVAPGFSNPPSRTGTIPNFAQAIGGGASAQSSLDLSEFPSLSGGPQAQNSSPMSMAWNSNALRQAQPPPQQQAPASRQNIPNDITRPPQPPGSLGFGSSLEDSFDNRAPAPARGDIDQAQLGGGDDFPPLGGVGGINGLRGHENRAGGVLPVGGLGAGPFGAQSNGQLDNESYSGSAADGITSPLGSHRTASNPTALNQQLPFRDNAMSSQRQPPIGQAHAPQQSQAGSEYDTQNADSPSSPPQPTQTRRRLSELTENDKWGLQGLLAQLPNRSEGEPGIVMGQDLNSLGVDFDSTEPLFPTFSTPFADSSSRSAIPDFTLPVAYTVSNVPPLHVRINTFQDETLFAIFYQYTRDVMQEIAAAELYTRDWRWHKELRQWMMKDGASVQPIRITERSERGVYLFFDAMTWRKERREFILNYDHLDQRHGAGQLAVTAP